MPTVIQTPQTPGPVKAPAGRAGANITVHDRARGAFQDMLKQKLEQKAEQIEQMSVEQSEPTRRGRRRATVEPVSEQAEQAGQVRQTGVIRRERRGLPVGQVGQVEQVEQVEQFGQAKLVSTRPGPRRNITSFEGRNIAADSEKNLMGRRAVVQDHRFRPGASDLDKPQGFGKRGFGAIKGLEGTAPLPSKDAEATVEFLKQARIAGLAGLHMTPAQVIEGMADEETQQQEVTLLWKDFMKRWLEGQKDKEEDKALEMAEETTDAEPIPRWDAYRAALSV